MIEKNQHKKIAYIISISRIFDVSWEWLFLFFCTFSFANLPNGGLLTALIFITCALTRASFSRKIAVIAQKKENRFKLSASIYCRILSVAAFILLPTISSNFYLLFLWIIIVNIITIFDEYLTFELRYIFKDQKYISITRFTSIFNLGKRGSVAISSIIAYMLGANNWQGLSYIFISVSLFGFLISIITLRYFGDISYKEIENSKKTYEKNGAVILAGIVYNEKLLFPLYLFLMNLFFSSIALLLSRALLEYNLVIFNSFNIITSFYIGFVVFNIFAVFFDTYFEKFFKPRHLIDCYVLTILMSCSIYLFRQHLTLCLNAALIFGIIYGFTLSCFYSLATTLIRGKDQNKLYATIDISGRLGMVISQLATGFLLDYHYDPLSLMANYGLIALSVPLLFFMFHTQQIIKDKQ